jgi:iron complex transport system substrate-binding protein
MARLSSLLLVLVCCLGAGPAGPQRIASGSLASDEVLIEILRQRGEMSRLVAVSLFADDPRYSNVADEVPKTLKGRVGGELESLLALRPDLAILASYNKPEILARLEDAKVPVLRLTEFRSLGDIEANITAIGKATATENDAEKVRAAFHSERQRLRALGSKLKRRPKVLDFAEDGVVSGSGTLFDALVREAGGTNLAADQGLKDWPKLSTEALAILRPDVIVTTGDPARQAEYLATMRRLPGWKEMPAVKAGKILVIPGRELSAVSPHVLKALRKLQAGIAP